MGEMKVITEDHILRYLPQARLGLLVLEVYTALTEIENPTSLDVIMRGLLPPSGESAGPAQHERRCWWPTLRHFFFALKELLFFLFGSPLL